MAAEITVVRDGACTRMHPMSLPEPLSLETFLTVIRMSGATSSTMDDGVSVNVQSCAAATVPTTSEATSRPRAGPMASGPRRVSVLRFLLTRRG